MSGFYKIFSTVILKILFHFNQSGERIVMREIPGPNFEIIKYLNNFLNQTELHWCLPSSLTLYLQRPWPFLIISGYRIFRGYKELCNAADRLPDVNHIVFVVHGVGGVMDESTIGRNAAHLRDNVSHILTKCFPKFQEQSGQRVEFFPVEWRTNLKLDEGLVDAITPQRVLGLRSVSDLFQ